MLIRLIFFVGMIAGLWSLVTWWRTQRLLAGPERGLSIGEFERLRKLARTHPRLERALQLRVNIVAAGEREQQAELSRQVDGAIRRLGDQLTLRKKIGEALDSIDRDQLSREVAGAKAQAAESENESAGTLAGQLSLQLEQFDRLKDRSKALDEAASRIVLLLGNLNLALLEKASSKAAEGDKVREVLHSLEEASDDVRRTSDAEAEVARMLHASRSVAHRE
ncbi:MAG: hypothetical protein AAFN74_15580 [Myxococcota bacterium]